MKRNLTILISLLAIFGLKMSAQDEMHFGVFVGGSLNMMSIDKSLYYDDSEMFETLNPSDTTIASIYYLKVKNASVSPNFGFNIGGFYEYRINELIKLHFEVLVNQTGYKLKGDVTQKSSFGSDSTTYSYKSSLKSTNIGASVIIKIQPLEYLSVDLGVQPTYCFRMIKDTEKALYRKTSVYDGKNEYNPLNFSAIGGITGYWGNFYLSARYALGFLDVLKVKKPYYPKHADEDATIEYLYDDAKSTTSSIQLTLGLRIR